MSELFVVVEVASMEIGHANASWIDVYGIFNNEDEARRFIKWRVEEDEEVSEEDFIVERIVPATAAGLL